jgi:membrane-bound lytic murein transglycosylase A
MQLILRSRASGPWRIVCALTVLFSLAALDAGAQTATRTYRPVAFSSLPSWSSDRHEKALAAFRLSCPAVRRSPSSDPAMVEACGKADALPTPVTRSAARAFFIAEFVPHRIEHDGAAAKFTGYYGPEYKGARAEDRVQGFVAPVYRLPEGERGHIKLDRPIRAPNGEEVLAARRSPAGLPVPYPTYEQISGGGLERELAVVWLKDRVDAFMLQIEGSARIVLPDGAAMVINTSSNTGYPAKSWAEIVRAAQRQGDLLGASPKARAQWMRANPERAAPYMHKITNTHFFSVVPDGLPRGSRGNPLQAERSIAVDAGCHAFGLPVYLSAPDIRHVERQDGFFRLMVAHDVGSAIKGPERADIFFGMGEAAEQLGSRTSSGGSLHVLLPRGFRDTPDPARPCLKRPPG